MRNILRPKLFVQLLLGSVLTAVVTIAIGIFILLITARIEERADVIINRLTPLSMLSASFEKNLNLALLAPNSSKARESDVNTRLVAERTAYINGLDLVALRLNIESGPEMSNELSAHLDGLASIIAGSDSPALSSEVSERHSETLRDVIFFSERLTSFINARLIEEEFELQRDTDSLRRIWVATFASLIAFGVLTAVYFSNRLTKRVSKMLAGAKEYARGNFNYKIGYVSNDELGELAGQMDIMSVELAKLTGAVRMLKTELVSTASHQLLTPLTRVRWSINEMQSELTNAQDSLKERLKVLHAVTVGMIDFVTLILDTSKIEGEEMYFDLRPVSLETLLRPVIDGAVMMAQEKHIRLTVEPIDQFLSVLADIHHIPAAFQNLMDNALRYTLPGGSIILHTERNGDNVMIRLADTGIGNPEKQRDKVFNKFFRADNAQKMVVSGNGLGLYITRTIIVGHGGSISFESEEGKGTAMTVLLPVAPDD